MNIVQAKSYNIAIMLMRNITFGIIPRRSLLSPHFKSFLYSQTPKMNPNKDYYGILNLPKDAGEAQILAAYSKLSIIYDPSINPAHRQKFNDLNEAKHILLNEKIRKQYDKERFYVKFTDEMNNRFQRSGEEPYYPQKKDRYSYDYTPQEEEALQKTKRFFKRVLIVGIGLAIFLPFVLWKGGDAQTAVNEAGYPIRPSSRHRAELARMQYEQQEMQQAYQQRYPNSPTRGYPQQGYQQNPNIVVTGQFVTD